MNQKEVKDVEETAVVTEEMNNRTEYEAPGVEEIRELLNKGQYTKLRQLIQELNDADMADYLEEMEESEVIKIFRILPKDMAADVFS